MKFAFNRENKEIILNEKHMNLPRTCIVIEDILLEIYGLFNARKRTDCLEELDSFKALVKYFKLSFEKVCQEAGTDTTLSEIYFAFGIPNHWEDEVIPFLSFILTKAGIVFTTNVYAERVMFVKNLEAKFLDFQTRRSPYGSLPPYIGSEERCILFDFDLDLEEKIKIRSTYFQFKEDYSLRGYNDIFYVPNIKSTNVASITIDWSFGRKFDAYLENHTPADTARKLSSIKLFPVSTRALKTRSLANIPKSPGGRMYVDAKKYFYDTIWGYLLKNAVNSRFTHTISVEGKVRLSPMLTEDVKDFLFSQQFVEDVIKEFASNVSKAVDYLESRCNDIPFVRKSILINSEKIMQINETSIGRLIALIKHILDGYPGKKQKYNSNVYMFSSLASPRRDIILSTCLLKLKRQAMLSNVSLAPILVNKQDILNGVSLPGYLPVSSVSRIDQFTPELIVYTDVSLDSITIWYEDVDKDGLIQSRFLINVENIGNLSSFGLFFDSEFAISEEHRYLTPKKGQRINSIYLLKSLLDTLDGTTKQTEISLEHSDITKLIKECILLYLKKLLEHIMLYLLTNKNVQLELVGYVFSFEKRIIDSACLDSRDEIAKFIKEKLIVNGVNTKRVLVVDQGEWIMHDMKQQKNNYQSMGENSYYAHSHISEQDIHLKLFQKVAIEETKKDSMCIMEKTVSMKNFYDQVSDQIWDHIQSIRQNKEENGFEIVCHAGEKTHFDNCTDSFKKFSEQCTDFVKKQLLEKDLVSYQRECKFRLSDCCEIILTLQQIMDLAIIPVVKQFVLEIASSLINTDIFGNFEVSRLYVTGRFLELSKVYQDIITAEMKKEFKILINQTAYWTECSICLDTYENKNKNSLNYLTKQKSLAYDRFLEGELCLVSDAAYFISIVLSFSGDDILKGSENPPYLRNLILRGDPLKAKRIIIDNILITYPIADYPKTACTTWAYISRYQDSLNNQEAQVHYKSQTNFCKLADGYLLGPVDRMRPIVIDIQALYHKSTILISCEQVELFPKYNRQGLCRYSTTSFEFGVLCILDDNLFKLEVKIKDAVFSWLNPSE